MFCPQCGAEIPQYMRECSQCGATINGSNQNIKKDYAAQATDRGISSGKTILQQYSGRIDISVESHPLVGIKGLLDTFLLIIKKPVESAAELYRRLEMGMTIGYSLLILLLNTVLGYVFFQQVIKSIVQDAYDILDYFFGYGTIQYIIDEVDLIVFWSILVLDLLEVVLFVVVVRLVYRYLFRKHVEWIEAIQLQLMPSTLKLVGRVCILVISLVSIEVAGVCFILWAIILMILSCIQVSSYIGMTKSIVYSLPILYLLVEAVRIGIIITWVRTYLW